MKRFGVMAAGCLTLAVIASAIFSKPAEETANPVRYEQIVPDGENQVVQPAQPNTNLRSNVSEEQVGGEIAGGLAVILAFGLSAGAVLYVWHQIRRVDQGRGGIHRPGVPYQGGPKKTT